MSYWGGWRPYVSQAERRHRAAVEMATLTAPAIHDGKLAHSQKPANRSQATPRAIVWSRNSGVTTLATDHPGGNNCKLTGTARGRAMMRATRE